MRSCCIFAAVYTDGSVLINHGGTEMGQGLHTKVAQVAATAFNVPLDKVTVSATRTDKVPNASATAASLSSDINGMAVLDACNKINEVCVVPLVGCKSAAESFSTVAPGTLEKGIPGRRPCRTRQESILSAYQPVINSELSVNIITVSSQSHFGPIQRVSTKCP